MGYTRTSLEFTTVPRLEPDCKYLETWRLIFSEHYLSSRWLKEARYVMSAIFVIPGQDEQQQTDSLDHPVKGFAPRLGLAIWPSFYVLTLGKAQMLACWAGGL